MAAAGVGVDVCGSGDVGVELLLVLVSVRMAVLGAWLVIGFSNARC